MKRWLCIALTLAIMLLTFSFAEESNAASDLGCTPAEISEALGVCGSTINFFARDRIGLYYPFAKAGFKATLPWCHGCTFIDRNEYSFALLVDFRTGKVNYFVLAYELPEDSDNAEKVVNNAVAMWNSVISICPDQVQKDYADIEGKLGTENVRLWSDGNNSISINGCDYTVSVRDGWVSFSISALKDDSFLTEYTLNEDVLSRFADSFIKNSDYFQPDGNYSITELLHAIDDTPSYFVMIKPSQNSKEHVSFVFYSNECAAIEMMSTKSALKNYYFPDGNSFNHRYKNMIIKSYGYSDPESADIFKAAILAWSEMQE